MQKDMVPSGQKSFVAEKSQKEIAQKERRKGYLASWRHETAPISTGGWAPGWVDRTRSGRGPGMMDHRRAAFSARNIWKHDGYIPF